MGQMACIRIFSWRTPTKGRSIKCHYTKRSTETMTLSLQRKWSPFFIFFKLSRWNRGKLALRPSNQPSWLPLKKFVCDRIEVISWFCLVLFQGFWRRGQFRCARPSWPLFAVLTSGMSHTRIVLSLAIKSRLGAHPFISKLVLFAREWNSFSYERLCT